MAVGGRIGVPGEPVVFEPIPDGEAAGELQPVNGRSPINSSYAGGTYPNANLPPELQAKYPSSVKFTSEGFPDFWPYAEAEVQVEGLSGNYVIDEQMANEAAGLAETPAGYVWHHVEDGVTMRLSRRICITRFATPVVPRS